MARNGGNYDAANAAFALALRRHFPHVDCPLAVRETSKTPTGGEYDLGYARAGGEETFLGEVAHRFSARVERRASQEHKRE